MRFLSVALLAILPAAAQQFTVSQLKEQPLTNENVVTLAKAGFDELFILQLIRSSRTNFDVSVPRLGGIETGRRERGFDPYDGDATVQPACGTSGGDSSEGAREKARLFIQTCS